MPIFYVIIYMIKLLQSDWLRGVQLLSLIALSRGAINDFRDGWGEREIKTTKIQYGGEIYLVK